MAIYAPVLLATQAQTVIFILITAILIHVVMEECVSVILEVISASVRMAILGLTVKFQLKMLVILIHVKITEHACQVEITILAFVQMTSLESTVI